MMPNRFYSISCWLLAVLLPFTLFANIQVSVELEPATLRSNQEIVGIISVTHSAADKINLQNTMLGDQKLAVTVLDEQAAFGGIKTRLGFSLPAQAAGLHLLPVIRVEVGGKRYATTQQAYSVGNAPKASAVPATASTAADIKTTNVYGTSARDEAWIKFESVVDGKTTLYPGQTTWVGYRYYYRGTIKLEKETAPLLHAKGFRKVGEPVIKEYQDKSFNLRQVLQQIAAVEPGVYTFAEGNVTGTALVPPTLGQPGGGTVQPIQAIAAAVTLNVSAFPDGAPTSFNGAVGTNFEFAVRLLSLAEIAVGDKFTLSLDIKGSGDLSEVPMPEICCQPGFSGNFQQSDIPPIGVVKGQTKYFVVDMRPLSPAIRAIPSVEFSYFHPEQSRYIALRSASIPVTVHPADTPFNKGFQESGEPIIDTKLEEEDLWPKGSSEPQPLEIISNEPLSSSDLKSPYLSNAWVLLLLPLALAVLWYQRQLKLVEQRPKKASEEPVSRQWMQKALASEGDFAAAYQALERAFLHLLLEKKQIDSADITPQQLSSEGDCGKVRDFLCKIEEQRYAGHGAVEVEHMVDQGKLLFDTIEGSQE
jgi:hypothetical protein